MLAAAGSLWLGWAVVWLALFWLTPPVTGAEEPLNRLVKRLFDLAAYVGSKL